LHTGLKLPYGTWFGKVREGEKVEEIDAKEPPLNMLIAMGMTAFLCVFTGVYPKALYNILPYTVTFHPYTAYHVVAMVQLLLLTAAAFWLFIDKLGGEPTVSVDTDWFYRKPGLAFLWLCVHPLQNFRSFLQKSFSKMVAGISGLTKSPILLPEVALRYVGLKTADKPSYDSGKTKKSKSTRSGVGTGEETGYDENTYRRPIGIGVIVTAILLFFYSLINLIKLS
jgi:hypothetical protein